MKATIASAQIRNRKKGSLPLSSAWVSFTGTDCNKFSASMALAVGWAKTSLLLAGTASGVFICFASPNEPGPTHMLCFACQALVRHQGKHQAQEKALPPLLCLVYCKENSL